ncbi:M28 family peptidase [Lacimicrobium sp. SS2-24]|uniref:M28 family peptidase n=1 Tax=Lacimicrobium sp. SS2-24 TaxID=2005569 RepID=UPI0014388838|nr:M28 family peptidase [Lacimicrobium sp. SS2-24]
MAGRETGSEGALLAQQYIAQVFTRQGISAFNPGFRHSFTFGRWLSEGQGVNLIGWVKGTELPECYIVVSAHYDHLGKKGRRIFYGADDNASGVAVMLVLASAIADAPLRHSVIFLATDAEEHGLHGAKAFVNAPPVPLSHIVFNLNLDMLGVGDLRQQLYIGGSRDPSLQQAIAKVKSRSALRIAASYPRQPRGFGSSRRIHYRQASDHGAFASEGIAFLFATTGDHAYYHTEQDRFDNLNITLMEQATEALGALLLGIDSLSLEYQK